MRRPARNDPPRWFRRALPLALIAAGVALAALIGLRSAGPEEERLRIGGRSLVVPAGDVTALVRRPHLFVRITTPDIPYDLVYDSRLQGRVDRRGVPLIFSINDEAQPEALVHPSAPRAILCRRASAPAAGCGTWLRHGAATWFVLFSESQLPQSSAIAASAIARLAAYDRGAR